MQDQFPELPEQHLTAPERAMVRAILAGEVADLQGQSVRGAIIRDAIYSSDGIAALGSFGLRVDNGIITGGLDLAGCMAGFSIAFSGISMPGEPGNVSLQLRDSHLRRLSLHDVEIAGSIRAERATFDNGMICDGLKCAGVLVLSGARVGHILSLGGSQIGDGRAACLAPGVDVEGPVMLRDGHFRGQILLSQSNIKSGIFAERANIELDHEDGVAPGRSVAFNLESAAVAGDLALVGTQINASINMENCRVGGRIEAVGAVVSAPAGAWNMSGLNVSHSLCLDQVTIKGGLQLTGAEVGKLFIANGIDIDGGETAIAADLIRVDGNFEMTSAKLVGQLRCPGADIRGQMRLSDTRLFGSDLALRGDGSRIRGGCFFSRAFIVGMVRFPASEFGNQFRFIGATIKVEHGAALVASGSRFARDVELGGGFETLGGLVFDQARIAGILNLTSSRVRSAAIARAGGQATPPRPQRERAANDEVALSLVDAEIGRLQMPRHGDERPRGVVDLSRARIGAFEDWANTWPPAPARRAQAADGRDIDHLVLDGLVYDHLVNPAGVGDEHHGREQDRSGQRRLAWLDGQHKTDISEHFRPQPWVQLASRLAAQGLNADARVVAVERRRRERHAHSSTGMTRWESRFLDWTALFGFNPWRTVLWSLVLLLVFTGFWSWAASQCERSGCFDQKVFVATNSDAYDAARFEERYPPFNALGFAMDNFVPIVDLGFSSHWRPNARYGQLYEISLPNIPVFLSGETRRDRIFTSIEITIGSLLHFVILIEQLLGLVFISLMATGFTGILRDRV